MHSEYFKRLCEGEFRESGERKVELHEDSLASVKAMIDWMYTFDYTGPTITTTMPAPEEEEVTEPRSGLELHAHVYTLGDKYNLQALKDLAVDKFIEYAKNRDDIVITDELLVKLADEFVPATAHIYTHSLPNDCVMRRVVLVCWSLPKDGDGLLGYVDKGAFEALVAEVPEFAADLVGHLKASKIGNCRPKD